VLTTEEPATPAQPAPTAPERRPWRRSRLSWAAAAAVAVLVAGFLLWQGRDDGPPPVTRAEVGQAVTSGIAKAQADARKAPTDAAVAYQTISPSLVTVTTTVPADAAHPKPGTSLGAGVVIRADGAILTALHVVATGAPIKVTFADGTVATGLIAAKQPADDIAVLTVDRLPGVVVPAVMGGAARIGDAVYPVGNPLTLRGSLSAGVVSGLDRSIPADDGHTMKGLIQFDAAVNPGSSGGPLLDRDGHVIGIVSGLVNPARQPYFVGIGFAVPIATAGDAAGSPAK
jgi:S1-C subfamily serine protease